MATMGRPPRPVLERFANRTRLMTNGCIEWTGGLDRDGYGSFLPAGGRSVRSVRVHRWAYEYFVGPIPDGFVIDHLCRNRACVNASHLEPVTARENWHRGFGPARINADKTVCPKGHPYSGANLIVNRQGGRTCRTCKRVRDLANYHKRKAA